MSIRDPEIHQWALRAAAGAAGLLKSGGVAAATGVALTLGCSAQPPVKSAPPSEQAATPSPAPTAPASTPAAATPAPAPAAPAPAPTADPAEPRMTLTEAERKARQDEIDTLRSECFSATANDDKKKLAEIQKKLKALGEDPRLACTPWGPPAPPAFTGARQA